MNADIHTLTGAYALDALSDDERETFEQHLAECGPCAAEVAELRETAARLGAAVAVPPPAGLKARVLADARRVRQQPPAPSPAAVTGVRPIRSRWQLWTAGAAAVMLAGVFAVQWVSADREVTQAQRQLDAVAAVLAAPDAKITTATVGDSRATVVVSHSQGKVAFVARSMPQLPADRSYQAWLIGPSGPRSVGVLAAGTDPAPLVGDLASDQRRIGVTIEPRGGSSQPSGDLVMQLELP